VQATQLYAKNLLKVQDIIYLLYSKMYGNKS